ncbi:unnamed protein product [Aspergillus oryzae]|nr:unnamed protein product [Aspergillus oryzae]
MDARMFRAASQNGWRADGIPGCEAVEADPPMTEKTEKEGGGEMTTKENEQDQAVLNQPPPGLSTIIHVVPDIALAACR